LKMHRALGASEEGLAPLREAVNRLPDLVREAAGAGVTVLAGADAGMAPHGLIREEIRRLRRAGLEPDRALGAASWAARSWLGLPGIEEGAPADLVAYRRNPLEHLDALAEPALIMLDGRIVLLAPPHGVACSSLGRTPGRDPGRSSRDRAGRAPARGSRAASAGPVRTGPRPVHPPSTTGG